MWIAITSKGVESVHSSEPYYNKLHNKWISIDSVYVPKGTLKCLGINFKPKIAQAFLVQYISDNTALIGETIQIYEKGNNKDGGN